MVAKQYDIVGEDDSTMGNVLWLHVKPGQRMLEENGVEKYRRDL